MGDWVELTYQAMEDGSTRRPPKDWQEIGEVHYGSKSRD